MENGSFGTIAQATHSDRCLEAFHCSSVVSGWWAIEPCPFERHSTICTNVYKYVEYSI